MLCNIGRVFVCISVYRIIVTLLQCSCTVCRKWTADFIILLLVSYRIMYLMFLFVEPTVYSFPMEAVLSVSILCVCTVRLEKQ